MADGLCGPSNALQDAQKHASADRSLQQDRLTSRQPQAQGFRSQNPRDGMLDPEFAAFEANLAGPALPDLQHPAHHGPPIQHAPVPRPNVNNEWASDFQNLHIAGHPPQPHLHAQPAAAAQSGWESEFLMHQRAAPMHPGQPQQFANRGIQPTIGRGYPMYNAPMGGHQVPQQMHVEQHASREQFDESAFEAAFEQARADLEFQNAQAEPEDEEPRHETRQTEPLDPVHEQIRIGSDNIPHVEEDAPRQANEGDLLAQTAGQLLESVQHDQSDKFQQSTFFALMRQLRDREVEVDGEEFRETAQSLHPGGRYYPRQMPPSDAPNSDRPR
ncbi:peroxin-20 [Penicillium capsulatum]|uniref:Peroxin-20 n=1 Tax=Penicillium capsulatum TaxID=69766 RepID=A0A9W9LWU7_9EURO|nr:peroxin-20 [Penicillium capsulatum]KAJ6122518.1 peroxin-20 Pex20-Penicillium chrysogenum [Penicillium capsulatum]